MTKKNLSSVYVGVNKSDKNRRKHDFYPTPPLATYVLDKYTNIPKNVIEPCAGRGNISVELQRCGKNVKSFDLYEYPSPFIDIITGQNVVDIPKQTGYDALITNPPYHKNMPLKIAKKGIEEYDYTALFVRLTFLEGTRRKKNLFDIKKPSSIIFCSDRIRFIEGMEKEPILKEDQIGGMIAYVWVVWDKNAKETTHHWVNCGELYDEWHENFKRKENSI